MAQPAKISSIGQEPVALICATGFLFVQGSRPRIHEYTNTRISPFVYSCPNRSQPSSTKNLRAAVVKTLRLG